MERSSSSHPQDLSDLLPRFDLRGMDLSLERMQLALKHLQSPAGSIPAVQVVGTNGKGSIACLIPVSYTHLTLPTTPYV